MSQADCIVLPSFYHEGTSCIARSSSCGSSFNHYGLDCRDVVDDGINGYLCKPKDAQDLAKKMLTVFKLSSDKREEMGANGRKKIIREFDERIVIFKYLSTISSQLENV